MENFSIKYILVNFLAIVVWLDLKSSLTQFGAFLTMAVSFQISSRGFPVAEVFFVSCESVHIVLQCTVLYYSVLQTTVV